MRRAKRVALLLLLVGVGGVAGALLNQDARSQDPGPTDPPPHDRLPAADGGGGMKPVVPKVASRPRGHTRPLRVVVEGSKGPEPGVFVRVVEHDASAAAAHECAPGRTTDDTGLAILRIDDPAPADAYLEVSRAGVRGLRHGLVPLSHALAGGHPGPEEEARVLLPEGGKLRVVLEGLPPALRPREIQVAFIPPYGEWLRMFRDLAVVPTADGGLEECGAVPRSFRFPIGDDGSATISDVPEDFVVTVGFPWWPPGFVVANATSTGPTVEATEGEALRVPAGKTTTHVLSWRERPEAKVRVLDPAGAPIEGARVAVGLRHESGAPRLFEPATSTDAAGLAAVALWSGARIPSWTPRSLLVVASAPGRRAVVVEVPGRWYGDAIEARLPAGSGGLFALEGRLAFEDGRPAPGIPVRLATAEPWNGHAAVDPVSATTDENGRFRLEASEDQRAVFAFGAGLRVRVDSSALEATREDALWRIRWPSLSRASVLPDTVALPATGTTGRADSTLILPP